MPAVTEGEGECVGLLVQFLIVDVEAKHLDVLCYQQPVQVLDALALAQVTRQRAGGKQARVQAQVIAEAGVDLGEALASVGIDALRVQRDAHAAVA